MGIQKNEQDNDANGIIERINNFRKSPVVQVVEWVVFIIIRLIFSIRQ